MKTSRPYRRFDPTTLILSVAIGLVGALLFPISTQIVQIEPPWLQILSFILFCASALLLTRHFRKRYSRELRVLNDWASDQLEGGAASDVSHPVRHTVDREFPELRVLVERLSSLGRLLDNQSRAQATRISRKTRSLDTLYEVVAALNISRNREELYGSFLDTLMELLDARASTLALVDDEQPLEVVDTRGEVSALMTNWQLGQAFQDLMHSVMRSGRMLIHRPAPAVRGVGTSDGSTGGGEQIEVIIVPVQYRDTVLGVFTLFLSRPSAELGDDFRDLITSLGKHLGLAIEKSRLDDQARRLAVMEERDILRNELHDTIAQYLVSMRLQVKMLGELLFKKQYRSAENEVWRLRLALEEANSSLRELLASFRFRMDERGLIPAVDTLVGRFQQDTGISTFFQHEVDVLDLSPSQEVELYRIVQEALANIRRHSQAATARVFLYQGADSGYRMVVEDDGIGMEETALEGGQGEHIGLAIMRERCRRLGGELVVESEPNEGTRVIVSLPTAAQSSSRIA